MLHVCTPLYRYENLPKIYKTIPNDSRIRWHIAYSSSIKEPNWRPASKDCRVVFYRVDCLDSEIYKKRNHIFDQINDGYFCLLDDDTVMHRNMFRLYKSCSATEMRGMCVGKQVDWKGLTRLSHSPPIFRKIDTGNVLCHHSCLSECRWPSSHVDGVNHKDFLFWDSVYKFYGERFKPIKFPISIYNKLSSRRR